MSRKKEETPNNKEKQQLKKKTTNKQNNNKEQLKSKKEKINIKSKLNKRTIMYIILLILDIIIIIYSARHNYANYITITEGNTMFVGDSKDLLFGKNYITLITTLFFFIYTFNISSNR